MRGRPAGADNSYSLLVPGIRMSVNDNQHRDCSDKAYRMPALLPLDDPVGQDNVQWVSGGWRSAVSGQKRRGQLWKSELSGSELYVNFIRIKPLF